MCFFTAQTISFSESTARKMFPAPNGEKKQKKELARWLHRTIVTYKIMQDWGLYEYLLYHIKVDNIFGRPPPLWQNCVRLQGQNLAERCKAKVDNSSYVLWYIMVLVVMLQYTIIPRRVSLTSRIKRGGETVMTQLFRFYRKLQKEIKADYSRNKKEIKAGVPPTFEEYWRYLANL